MAWTRTDMDAFPRLGWVAEPTPVTALDGLAAELGLVWLGVKRDDAIPELHGGSKIRKLDFLLAAPPWRDAAGWASMGATGSGQLVASAAAARHLGKAFDAYVFWEPITPGVLENLAFTATHATRVRYFRGRVRAALRHPGLAAGGKARGAVVIPPGATHPVGSLGTVRGGIELAEQVRDGEIPEPDALYLPLGSCGTAAGLAVGLGLGGLRTRVHAVAVERPFARQSRVDRLVRRVVELLGSRGRLPQGFAPAPLVVDKRFVGAGYGHPSPEGLAAIEALAPRNVRLEAVYSGKAMACLLAGAEALAGQRVLFWFTPHGPSLPATPDWRSRLPPALRRRLAGEPERSRRRFFVAGVLAMGATAAIGVRTTGYPDLPPGEVLAPWELAVVAAAAEALQPSGPGPGPGEVARNVDRYLVGVPSFIARDIHGMLALVEHGTGLGCRGPRFTRLDVAARLAFLDRLRALPSPVCFAPRGIRDLVMVGHYQDPRTWPALAYLGPLTATRGVDGRPARRPGRYDGLRAAPGTLPAGAIR